MNKLVSIAAIAAAVVATAAIAAPASAQMYGGFPQPIQPVGVMNGVLMCNGPAGILPCGGPPMMQPAPVFLPQPQPFASPFVPMGSPFVGAPTFHPQPQSQAQSGGGGNNLPQLPKLSDVVTAVGTVATIASLF